MIRIAVCQNLAARDRWRPLSTPKGEIKALRPPPVITGFDQPMGPVPGLGEHTDAVLAELGYSETEIKNLRADGVIELSVSREYLAAYLAGKELRNVVDFSTGYAR